MINKIRFFGGELRRSLLFVIVVTLQVAIGIFLLNMTLTKAFNSTVDSKYYSKAVADKSFVLFKDGRYTGEKTVGELSKIIDLQDLATTAEIGEIENTYVDSLGVEQTNFTQLGLATPALMKTFNTFNTKIAVGNTKGYYEAQLSDEHPYYKVGQTYETNFQKGDGTEEKIKIKIVGNSGYHDYFYNFEKATLQGQIIHPYIPFQIMICDELAAYDYAELSAGIFMGDQKPSYYESFGFATKTIQNLYDETIDVKQKDIAIVTYMAIVLMLFTLVSTFCLYMIDVYKSDRKRAVNYICGVTPQHQLAIESIKMAVIFIVAFIPNLIISIFLGTKEMYNIMGENMLTVPYAFASMAIMLGVYGSAIAVGMVKYVKTNPIKIINNVH